MSGKVLLITNDFPPRDGGIESYLRDFAALIEPQRLVVLASTRQSKQETTAYDATLPYRVYRMRDRVLLPLPHVARRAARIIEAEQIDTVWFGAAAPLALLAPACRRAGARRIIATTHGHEVGWSMIPIARSMLGAIGRSADAITYISRYTRSRIATAFGPQTPFERLPSGVDIDRFEPSPEARTEIRTRHGLTNSTPVVVCISRLVLRKGQDSLIKAMPEIVKQHADAQLIIVGKGPYRAQFEKLAQRLGVASNVIFTGGVDYADLPGYYNAATVFAMPARTRGFGLDVEGLGIVYLEAQACGVPVIAGTSGGAPETVVDGETGFVVNGRQPRLIAAAINKLFDNPELAQQMGAAGREHVQNHWTWAEMGRRLHTILGLPPASV